MIQSKRQTFHDGVAEICAVKNIAAPGDRPQDGLVTVLRLRFKRRTVGVKRYGEALQNGVKIAELLRCPLHEAVSTQNVVVLNGVQYRIEQVQYPEGIVPRVMDLSLSKVQAAYAR